jgi:hypothetical protein
MMGIIRLQEYAENGDEDIFTPLNQRNSAVVALKSYVPEEWDGDLMAVLPKYLSQTDLRFIRAMIDKIAPGSMTRHMKAYFANHSSEPQAENFKGDLAELILNKATGWTLEALKTLPAFVSRDEYKQAYKLVVDAKKRFEIAPKLAEFFK